MWFEVLLQRCTDAMQSARISGPVRILCIVLISLLFWIGMISLFLLTFVIEGQSFLRRVGFLLLGLGILGYYLQFLKTVTGKRKGGKKS